MAELSYVGRRSRRDSPSQPVSHRYSRHRQHERCCPGGASPGAGSARFLRRAWQDGRRQALPLFFAENGSVERQYQIDAYNATTKVALEIEAGRSVLGNAIYRDLIQMSMLVDVSFAAVAVPIEYRYRSKDRQTFSSPYRDCTSILEAIYGGRRLELPFEGFLLIGY